MKPLVLLALLVASAAIAGVAPTDRQLIGSWTFAAMDSTHTLTFERDHTFSSSVWSGGERFIEASGTWQLRRATLRRTITYIAGGGARVPRVLTETVTRVDQKTLVLGGATYTRDRRPPKPTI